MTGESLFMRITGCMNLTGDHELVEQMARHYQTLHLLGPDGTWASPRLDNHAPVLLPFSITRDEGITFLRRMLDLALQNPFLADFLNQVETAHFPALEERFCCDGQVIIPDVLAFAMALERLASVCANDYHMLEECRNLFRKAWKETGALRSLPFFYQIKFRSVDPVVYYMINAHKRPPELLWSNSGSRMLQLNILEATFSDLKMGLWGNADAGWALAVHKCGKRRINPLTGAGSNFWSSDGKTICFRHPFQKTWVDLYQSWNMAFVAKMYDFPYIITKLLIPRVAGYAQQPEAYMCPRVIALYFYLNWLTFDNANRKNIATPLVRWDDLKLVRFWGALNRDYARVYRKMCKAASRPSPLPFV